jgi:hypothetical protein
MVIWCLKLVNSHLCKMSCNYWLMTTQKKSKTWCKFEERICNFKNYELKFTILSQLFTFDVEKADELQMELIETKVLWGWCTKFLLSPPGTDSKKLLNWHTKYVQCLAAQLQTVVSTNEEEQNTEAIMADGHTFFINYDGNFSTRFKTRDSHPCCK